MLADMPSFTLFNILMTSVCYICIGLNPDWPKLLNAVGIMLLVVYTVMSAGEELLNIYLPFFQLAEGLGNLTFSLGLFKM